MSLKWPLMQNNLPREDLDEVIEFLKQDDPILTQSKKVALFEEEWSKWLGVKYSIFVNSGSSANLLGMAAVKQLLGEGEVIVPTLTWVSDIASVFHAGLTPVFVDIDMKNLAMSTDAILDKITDKTKAVFLTHILGYNGLSDRLLNELKARNIPLIEDVCESHGATHNGMKLGSLGWMSHFSFYYAHHLTTIEGGMICTDDEELYQALRVLRSHGMVRESTSNEYKENYKKEFPDLNPDFIFAYPTYNVRSTEINAVLGLSQLKRLDTNNQKRKENLSLFLEYLDEDRFYTDFDQNGNSNYAFTLVLKDKDDDLRDRLEKVMDENGVEYRRGTSGGGNQLRQPYLRKLCPDINPEDYPNVEHVHFYGYYIGNYPTLDSSRIKLLCDLLNLA